MIKADVIDALVAAGWSAKQIAELIRADEKVMLEKNAAKREATRIRVQKHRARNALHGVTRVTSVTQNSLFQPEELPVAKPVTAKMELGTVLDPVHVAAVIEHRQKIKKPLTAHAASLLAGKFAKCPDPNIAADVMVANGWQGFEPQWLDDRTRNRSPPGFRTSDDILATLKRHLDDDDDPHSNNARNHQDADYPLLGFAAKGHDRE